MQNKIFTIGIQNMTPVLLLHDLFEYKIDAVIDVRSQPADDEFHPSIMRQGLRNVGYVVWPTDLRDLHNCTQALIKSMALGLRVLILSDEERPENSSRNLFITNLKNEIDMDVIHILGETGTTLAGTFNC